MLIMLVEGSKPIAVTDLTSIPWTTINNGFQNCAAVNIRISVNSKPTGFFVLDDYGFSISHGELADIYKIQLYVGDVLRFFPNDLTIQLDPLQSKNEPLFSTSKLTLIGGGPHLLEYLRSL